MTQAEFVLRCKQSTEKFLSKTNEAHLAFKNNADFEKEKLNNVIEEVIKNINSK